MLIPAYSFAQSQALQDKWSVVGQALRLPLLIHQLERKPNDRAGFLTLKKQITPKAFVLHHKKYCQTKIRCCFIEGKLFLSTNKKTQALKRFKHALVLSKGHADYHLILGWIMDEFVERAENKLAISWVKRELKDRNDQKALKLMVQLMIARNNSKQALSYQLKLSRLKHDTKTFLLLARLQEQQGELSAAEKSYQKLITFDQPPSQRCEILYEHGHLLDKLEQFDRAIKNYKKALKLTKTKTYLHRQLQRAILAGYYRRGRFEELIKECRTILSKEKTNPLALRYLADYSINQTNNTEQSIDYLERYLKQSKRDIKRRSTLMFLLLRLNRNNDALKHAEKLYLFEPKDIRRLTEYLGLLKTMRKNKKAKEVLEQSAQLFKKEKNKSALFSVAEMLSEYGEEKKAEDLFQFVLELDKNDARYRNRYGHYCWKKAKYKKAIRLWAMGSLKDKKKRRLSNARFLEHIERVEAWRFSGLKKLLKQEVEKRLKLTPRHRRLWILKERLMSD